MESNQEEAKSLLVSEENKSDPKQEDYDFIKNQDLQTLFDKLAQIEQLKLKLDRFKQAKSFEQLMNFDLIKMLRGTQYSSIIKQFFEFDMVFKKLEEGFKKTSVLLSWLRVSGSNGFWRKKRRAINTILRLSL